MRLAIALVFLLASGCSVPGPTVGSDAPLPPAPQARFADSDDDGIPDARASQDSAQFADADADGLPDTRGR